MASKTSANYQILVGVDFETKQVQKRLNELAKDVTLKVKTETDTQKIKEASDAVKKIKESTDETTEATKELGLQWQEAKAVMQFALNIIKSMADEVYALDASMTDFQKVSDLTGESLKEYVSDLAAAGKTVARTGRPLCLSRNVQMANVH